MLRHLWRIAASLALLALLFCLLNAQDIRPHSPKTTPPTRLAETSGLNTSRLSSKDLERWKSIERLALAEGSDGQPLHPTLRNLWEWIETSGHTVFVEISRSTRKSTCTAGSFVIERFDPKGDSHIAVVSLNLANIDLAYVGQDTARENGFIPFEGLSKDERYVEVLGHELAHAVYILTSLERAKKVEDMVEKTNELLLSRRPYQQGKMNSPELNRMLSRRDALLKDLEKQAEEMEYVVWRELVASKSRREKLSPSSAKP
jgi:hypothetical protein